MPDLSEADRAAQWLKDRDAQEANNTALILQQAATTSADQHAADMTLAAQSRVPVEVLDPTNRPYFQAQVKKRLDAMTLEQSPRLRQWLGADFNNPKLAQDDIPTLGWWDSIKSGAVSVAKEGQSLSDAVGRGVLNVETGVLAMDAGALRQIGEDQKRTFNEIYKDTIGKPGGELTGNPLNAGYRWLQARVASGMGVDDTENAKHVYQLAGQMFNYAQNAPKSAVAMKFQDMAANGDPALMPQTPELMVNDPANLSKPGDIFTQMLPMKDSGKAQEPEFQALENKMEGRPQVDTSLMGTAQRWFHAAAKNPVGAIAWSLETAAEFTPQMVAAGLTTAATRNPEAGAAVMGGGNYPADLSGMVQDLKDKGFDLSKPEDVDRLVTKNPDVLVEAAKSGQIHALITSIGAVLTMGVAGNKLAKNPIVEYFAQSISQSVLDVGSEMYGEYAAGQKLDWNQGLGEFFGGLAQAPGELLAAGRDIGHVIDEAAKAKQRAAFFQQLSGQAVSSKLRERMPEKFQEFVAQATAGGPVENLYVKADEFQGYFQSRGIDPQAVLAELGIPTKDFTTAIETGGDVVIPTAQYAAKIAGSEHDQFMLENMRLRPEDMSAVEAQDFNLRKQEILDEARALSDKLSLEELASVSFRESIRNEISSRLQMAGRSADVSRVEGTYYAELYGAMAERNNLTVEELLQQVPLPQFRGQVPLGAALRANDQFAKTMALVRQRAAANANIAADKIDAAATGQSPSGEQAPAEEASGEAGAGEGNAPAFAEHIPSSDPAGSGPILGTADLAGSEPVRRDVGLSPEEQAALTGEPVAQPSTLDNRLDDVEAYLHDLGLSLDNSDEEIRNAVEADAQRIAGERAFNQAISLRKGQGENLRRYGLVPGKRYTTLQIARALEQRQREKFGVIDRKDRSDAARDKIAKWMAEEVRFELEGKDPASSGVGWYSTKFQNALDAFGSTFPELVDDHEFVWSNAPGLKILGSRAQARNLLTVLIAVTSDGMKVRENFRMATEVYRQFRDTGEVGATEQGGRSINSINANLQQIGALLKQFGPEGMHEYLMREATVTDLKKFASQAGVKLSVNYPANRVLPQSAVVFGPKLGAFYANLMGADGYLTMDRWFSRTFNRYRGQLLTAPTKEGVARVRELIGKETGTDTSDWADDQVILAAREFQKSYKKKGFKNGTELEKAANTVAKDAGYGLTTGTEDSPFNTKDRGFMIDTVEKAREILGNMGHMVSTADVQAILWYYEKRLLSDLGATATADISYEDTAKEIVDGAANAGDAAEVDDGPDAEGHLELSDGQGLSAADIDAFIADGAGRRYGQGGIAAAVQGDTGRLTGLPSSSIGPNRDIAAAASKYLTERGIPFRRQASYVQVDVERATRLAQAFEEMKHNPSDPEVKAAYAALIDEVKGQYQAVLDMGLKIDVIEEGMADPYPEGPRQVLEDLRNGHIWLYPTSSGFGTITEIDDNPLLVPTEFSIAGRTLLANDLFRVVHDVFGHGREGVGFGASGEENTWQSHVRMFTPLAARAMTTETRGQNSWVNYGPHGEHNRANQRETIYADQKIGLLPEWATTEGIEDAPAVSNRSYDQPAYHGSPAAHDKFDLNHLGSGEGIHDHGWGFYFSRSEAGADLYRSTYSRPVLRSPTGETIRQETVNRARGAAGDAIRAAWGRVRSEGLDGALQTADADVLARPHDRVAKSIAGQLRKWKDAGYTAEDQGRTFTVEVPDDAEMLNYDGKQSDLVAGILAKAGIDGKTGRDVYEGLSKKLGSDRKASERLRDLGIPGLYYAKGQGELVVWDQERVKIQGYVDGAKAPERPHLFDRQGDLTMAQAADGSDARAQIVIPQGGITKGATINLFRGADLSSVIHETGHFMLEMMRHFARQPTAPQQIKDDFQAILSWNKDNAAAVARDGKAGTGTDITADDVIAAIETGTTGDGAKDDAVDVGLHEQFAKAAEVYAMEGKAPSIALAGVFEKFRAWLLRLYKRVLGLGVEVSPELRRVFDRMLATDDAIQVAQVDSGDMDMLFKSAEAMGISPDAYDQLMKLHSRARSEAIGKLTREIMEPLAREERVWYRAEMKKTLAEVEAEMKASGTYRAIQELRYGRSFEGDDLTPPVKLDPQAITAEYGPGYLPLLPGATKDGRAHRFSMVGENGLHPDVVANMYGFDTGKEFLDAVTAAPPLQDGIKAEAERRMHERHGDPLNDGSVEDAAQSAVHNDSRARVIAAELSNLHQIAGKGRAMTWEQAKSLAHGILRDTTVGMTYPSRFLAAERKASRRALQLMAKVTRSEIWTQAVARRAQTLAKAAIVNNATEGLVSTNPKVGGLNEKIGAANERVDEVNKQIDDLIQAKREQLLNHALYDGARQVQKEVDRLTTLLSRLNKGDKKLVSRIDLDHVKAARAIASKFGLAKADSAFDFAAWSEQLTRDNPMLAGTMANLITTYTQDAKPYQKLTVDEISAVWDAIDSVLEQGRHITEVRLGDKTYLKEQVMSDLSAVLQARTKAKNKQLSTTHTSGDKLRVRALSILASLRRMEAWTRDMDDGKPGPFNKYFIRPVFDALANYRTDKNTRLKELVDILDPMRESLLKKSIKAEEISFAFANKGELLHAILHTGNDSNKRKLLIGMKWGTLDEEGKLDSTAWDNFVARAITDGTLTKADFDFAQKVWDLMESTKRPAQKAHRQMLGYYFKEVENTPFTNKFGTYKGGYVPAIADRYASIDGPRNEAADIMNHQQNAAMFPAVGNGFTKSRVENYATPLALDLTLLPAHLDKVVRFTHLGPVVQQLAGFAMDRNFKQVLAEFDPSVQGSLILPWLQRVASQQVETPPIEEDGRAAAVIWRALRARTGLSTMFLNIVNTLQQIMSLPTALIRVKGLPMMSAMMRFGTQAQVMRREAADVSPYMRDRLDNKAHDLSQRIEEIITKPTNVAEFKAWMLKHGYFMQSAFQNQIDVVVWHAAYDQAIQNGRSHADAVYDADETIRSVMSDMNPESVSKFETGSAFKRLFTMFYSFFNGQANLVAGEMQTVMRTMGWSGSGRMFWVYMVGVMLPAIGAEAISRAFRGGFDDDKDGSVVDDLGWMFLGSQAKYIVGAIPVLGAITTAVVNRFNGQFYDDKLSVSPALSMVDTAVSTPSTVYKGFEDPQKGASKAVADGILLLGMVTGIPLGQLAKTAKYGVEVHQGKQRPQGVTDVVKGVVTGRDSTPR